MSDFDALEACARAALAADFDPVPWEDAPVWRRLAAAAVSKACLDTGNPDFARSAWFLQMTTMGWRWDRHFNEAQKTHPGIVAGELTRSGSKHWENVVKQVRDIGRARGVRMLGP